MWPPRAREVLGGEVGAAAEAAVLAEVPAEDSVAAGPVGGVVRLAAAVDQVVVDPAGAASEEVAEGSAVVAADSAAAVVVEPAAGPAIALR